MANREISELTLKSTPENTDEIEIQETGGGSSRKTTLANIADLGTDVLDPWDATVSYDTADLVRGSNDKFYISLTDSNFNNDPISSAANWSEIDLLRLWNTNETYPQYDLVTSSTGGLFESVQSQSGNDPTSDDGTNWVNFLKATDIVESTWTPRLTDLSNDATHTDQDGKKIIINDMIVIYSFNITISSKGSLSGGLYIEDLGTNGGSGEPQGGGIVTYMQNMNITAGESLTMTGPGASNDRLELYLNDGTGGMSRLDASEINTGCVLRGQGFYFKG